MKNEIKPIYKSFAEQKQDIKKSIQKIGIEQTAKDYNLTNKQIYNIVKS